jgi:hypothetical protein
LGKRVSQENFGSRNVPKDCGTVEISLKTWGQGGREQL